VGRNSFFSQRAYKLKERREAKNMKTMTMGSMNEVTELVDSRMVHLPKQKESIKLKYTTFESVNITMITYLWFLNQLQRYASATDNPGWNKTGAALLLCCKHLTIFIFFLLSTVTKGSFTDVQDSNLVLYKLIGQEIAYSHPLNMDAKKLHKLGFLWWEWEIPISQLRVY